MLYFVLPSLLCCYQLLVILLCLFEGVSSTSGLGKVCFIFIVTLIQPSTIHLSIFLSLKQTFCSIDFSTLIRVGTLHMHKEQPIISYKNTKLLFKIIAAFLFPFPVSHTYFTRKVL